MTSSALSKNGIPVRLPDERWKHITAKHPELSDEQAIILDIVNSPDRVLRGQAGELLAIRELVPGKWLVVAYREVGEDGFILLRLTQLVYDDQDEIIGLTILHAGKR